MIGPFSIVDLAFLSLLVLIVLLLTAWVRNADRSSAKDYVDQKVDSLTDRIELQGEEFRRITTGQEDRINDLREWLRNIDRAMREELGIDLSPPTVSLRLSARAGSPTASANLTVIPPANKIVRIRFWIKNQVLRLWKLAYKWVWDWDDN